MCLRRTGRMKRVEPHGSAPFSSSESDSGASLTITNNFTNKHWSVAQIFDNWIYAWTLPQHISQSRFGGRRKPSSACTIIALAMARVYHRSGMKLPAMPLSREGNSNNEVIIPVSLLALLTNSIVDGNAVHAREMAKRQSSRVSFLPTLDTFTIPQGIEALGGVINEIDYRSVRGTTWKLLPQHIQHAIDSEYIAHLPALFFVLIIVERAVLIVHERDNGTIAILDSHSHMQGKKGAVIAISHVANLRQFSSFICQNLFPEVYKMQPEQMLFEISCIQYCGPEKSTDSEGQAVKAHVFPRPVRLCSGEDKPPIPSSSMDSERIAGSGNDIWHEFDSTDKNSLHEKNLLDTDIRK
ncbi:unnamed protein product [Cylicocyclus nassatus]|uniref:Uncharacterized protein n=1 Tax=Cylicocyclus nassatus TaxID=53992 RepID=A0AA36M8V5_CYLNA|nr:unnamed protein product [Cylicocyclus nassatus]